MRTADITEAIMKNALHRWFLIALAGSLLTFAAGALQMTGDDT